MEKQEQQKIIDTIFSQITLVKHLGLQAELVSKERVSFKALLSENLNHKSTAFGGSLYAIAVSSAYALVLAKLKESKVETENIVIAQGQIKYIAPVDDDFVTDSQVQSVAENEIFLDRISANKKATLTVASKIFCNNKLCAEFIGLFVVKPS